MPRLIPFLGPQLKSDTNYNHWCSWPTTQKHHNYTQIMILCYAARQRLKLLFCSHQMTLSLHVCPPSPRSSKDSRTGNGTERERSRSRSMSRFRPRSIGRSPRLTPQLLRELSESRQQRFPRVTLRLLSGDKIVFENSEVEQETISGERTIDSMFHMTVWLVINPDGSTTAMNGRIHKLVPAAPPPGFRKVFDVHCCDNRMAIGIHESYTAITQ